MVHILFFELFQSWINVTCLILAHSAQLAQSAQFIFLLVILIKNKKVLKCVKKNLHNFYTYKFKIV